MCAGTREDGSAIEPNDPQWDSLQQAAMAARQHPGAWLEQPLYGTLADAPAFADAFSRALAAVWEDGTEATLSAFADRA